MRISELARLGGSQQLSPVPLELYEKEVVAVSDGLVERNVLFIFSMPGRIRRSLNLGEPLYVLLSGLNPSSVAALARSLALTALAIDAIGDEGYEPVIVVADHSVSATQSSLIVEYLLERYGRGVFISDYGMRPLALSLGREYRVCSSERGDRLVLLCRDRDLCRACALLLNSTCSLDSVVVGSSRLSGSSLDAFLSTGVVKGESGGENSGGVTCEIEEHYSVLRGDCIFSRFYRLLAGGKHPDIGTFPSRSGLDECSSLVVLGFKRLSDIVRVWRVV